ncbi:MAG: ribonuclease-3 [Halieaceae bacterium]|jgi:ribonuclease-3
MSQTDRLQKALGYKFTDPNLLQLALTHRSVGKANNERLEFLGDSIVNHVVAEFLFHRFPRMREGNLSRMRAALVKGVTLAEVARELQLGEYLNLGPGERKSGGNRRDSILADTLEGVAGAILLDGGYAACRERILAWLDSRLANMTADQDDKDAKTLLQEYLQGRSQSLPEYVLVRAQGEDHAQTFLVACKLPTGGIETQGSGTSRRSAEQAAAQSALEEIARGDA